MTDDPVSSAGVDCGLPLGACAAKALAATASAATAAHGDDDPIMGAAKSLGGAAPWKKGARWEVVVTQGVILGVAGLIIWLAPGFGASAALQLIAVLLLAMALLSTWRILRGAVAPQRMATVAVVCSRPGFLQPRSTPSGLCF